MKFMKSISSWLRARPLVAVSIACVLFTTIYWSVVASDIYVSEAHLVLQRTDAAVGTGKATDLVSLMTGTNASRDLLLLRDYLRSNDMMVGLDRDLALRSHYGDPRKDVLSRLWFWNRPYERFHDYFLSRVDVTYDDYSQVLVVRARAYSPDMAHAIADAMIHRGEQYMNQLDNQLAREQVEFVDTQIVGMRSRMQDARRDVLQYQNKHGLVSPKMTVESVSAVVAQLEQKRADLLARRQAMAGYLTASAPDMVQINTEIDAIARQIAEQNARLASVGNSGLNVVAEQQELLESRAEMAESAYKAALAALEKQRIDAVRKLKSVQILQTATFPDYPMEPRRIYNVMLSAIIVGLITLILSLLIAIVRDHRD